MKITTIGDVHGRFTWKQIVDKEINSDKIVFIGDYFDTHDKISGKKQIDNFKEIMEFKKDNRDKVTILIGNHDFHYIKGSNERYSGYNENYALEFGEVLERNLEYMQMCLVQDRFLFSHAGVTNTWYNTNIEDEDITNVEDNINELFECNKNVFNFTIGPNYSNTGNDITQSPIWVRPESLAKDKLDEYTFIVGHTQCPNLEIGTGEFEKIIKIDTMGYSKEYLTIEDGVFKINKL